MSIKAILEGLAASIEGMCPAGEAQTHLARAREMIAALPEEDMPAKAKRKRVAESVSRETDGAIDAVHPAAAASKAEVAIDDADAARAAGA